MRNSKLVASAVVSAFLLPSLWTALPMNARYAGWYWPFLDYPMYSRAHYVGETTSTHELRLRSCAPADSVTVADYRELGLHNLRFWDLMREAAGDGAGATAAQDQLTAVIRGRKATSFCETEL